jgi:hypothetical protein
LAERVDVVEVSALRARSIKLGDLTVRRSNESVHKNVRVQIPSRDKAVPIDFYRMCAQAFGEAGIRGIKGNKTGNLCCYQ